VKGLLLGLAFAGGSVDASTYLSIGHAFPANMTGNTVLIALAAVRGAGSDALRSGLALGGFCIGVTAGTALLRNRRRRPEKAVLIFGLEAAALIVLLLWWALIGSQPRYALIAVAAVAMGAQSTAVRFSHVGGVSTTYVTGTLTTAITSLVLRLRGRGPDDHANPTLPAGAWLVYGIGAFVGGLTAQSWHAGEVAIPLAIVLTSLLVAVSDRGR
jgi:uncharacterized membrane protein YoaK (UPF0700 family)